MQHVNWSQHCSEAQRLEVSGEEPHPDDGPEDSPSGTEARRPRLRRRRNAGGRIASKKRKTTPNEDADLQATSVDRNPNTQDYDANDEFDDEETDFDDENVNPHDTVVANMGGYREPLDDFRRFCDGHSRKFKELTKEEEGSIKLMDILRRKKAPLNAFPEVLEWHLKECGKI